MSQEILMKFYQEFDIEKIRFRECKVDSFCPYEDGRDCEDCVCYEVYKIDYPPITDTMYFELVVCLSRRYFCLYSTNEQDLKEEILSTLTEFKGIFYTEVRKIILGGEE